MGSAENRIFLQSDNFEMHGITKLICSRVAMGLFFMDKERNREWLAGCYAER